MDTAILPVVLASGSLTFVAYALFVGLVLGFLILDLSVFHREAHEVKMKEAVLWSIFWLSLGVAFSGVVYVAYEFHWLGLGQETRMYNPAAAHDARQPLIVLGEVTGGTAAVQYLTGYIVEKSLAMDNLFVIALVFGYFGIPGKYQHRVLFWGIVGALVMRGVMIIVGGELIMAYQWILIIFGLFLVLTAVKMAIVQHNDDPGANPLIKLVKRLWPVTNFFDGQRFFTRRTTRPVYKPDPTTGKLTPDQPAPGTLSKVLMVTPLLPALVMVEITDLVFAVDSIPAIFAITPDTFIVFTSNIFAILGLRALYFCLAVLIASFRFLKPALVVILAYVGVKLLLMSGPPYLGVIGLEPARAIKIDPFVSLAVVLALLALAVVASILWPMPGGDASHGVAGPGAGSDHSGPHSA